MTVRANDEAAATHGLQAAGPRRPRATGCDAIQRGPTFCDGGAHRVRLPGEDSKSDEFGSELKGLHGGLTCYPQIYPSQDPAGLESFGTCWARMSRTLIRKPPMLREDGRKGGGRPSMPKPSITLRAPAELAGSSIRSFVSSGSRVSGWSTRAVARRSADGSVSAFSGRAGARSVPRPRNRDQAAGAMFEVFPPRVGRKGTRPVPAR
jgi:hypothetical protein